MFGHHWSCKCFRCWFQRSQNEAEGYVEQYMERQARRSQAQPQQTAEKDPTAFTEQDVRFLKQMGIVLT